MPGRCSCRTALEPELPFHEGDATREEFELQVEVVAQRIDFAGADLGAALRVVPVQPRTNLGEPPGDAGDRHQDVRWVAVREPPDLSAHLIQFRLSLGAQIAGLLNLSGTCDAVYDADAIALAVLHSESLAHAI